MHTDFGDHRTALSNLKYARLLGIWFHRVFTKNPSFNPGPFIPPPDPAVETEALKQELEKLRNEAKESTRTAEQAQIVAHQEAQLRASSEELVREAESKAQEALSHLAVIQARAINVPTQIIQQTIQQAIQAATKIDLDERETRRLVDRQLQAAGWEADSEQFTYQNGTRPQKGRNMAIAEWLTEDGRADYALFVGLQIVAVVEAKRQRKDVSGAIDQAKRYSRGFKVWGNETLPGGPWGEFKVPFVFATNGREFLQQLRTKSGIWFCDLRRPDNLRHPLPTWYSPQGLIDTLSQNIDQAYQRLEQEGFDYNLKLRDYQIKAIQKVESALAQGQSTLLIVVTRNHNRSNLKSSRF